MASIVWKIASLDAINDYVVTAHWRVTGTEGAVFAELAGCIGFANKSSEAFKPYGDLAESEVLDWVKGQIGNEEVARIEADIAAQIDARAILPVTSKTLPWEA